MKSFVDPRISSRALRYGRLVTPHEAAQGRFVRASLRGVSGAVPQGALSMAERD
ncbi:hypothetical protein [Sorangium sp. So ce426]|uniref:hypothetical protein n=1 Tax=unclassified Sorangium TaxID=2621164 RepID=UPI003F5B6558